MDKLYSEFSRGVVRNEYRTVMPVTDLNFNTTNNYTVFKLDHGDSFYHSRMLYHIQGDYVKSDGSNYTAKSTIKLVNNFAAFLWSRVELKKHNTLIDSIELPGITSTIKGLLTYKSSKKTVLPSSGFISKFEGGGKFEALGTLGHLGLGFFDHLRHPMFKGGFEITFTRASDNDALMHWKGSTAGATEPEDGKVVIKSFTLLIPLVEYSATAKIQLINGLERLSRANELVYNFYQWQCIEKKGVFGNTFTFDITNSYRNVYNPRFIIIGLHTNRGDDQQKDPSEFDSCSLKNATVRINGERYPQENQNINESELRYRIMFDQYTRFRLVNFGDEEPLVDPVEFKSKYPITVIDTHLHPENTDRSRSDIQVELDFTNAVASPTASSGTNAFVLVVSESHFMYDITSNIIRFI